MSLPVDSTIRVRPCPKCPICQGDGSQLYRDLKDRLFGAEGDWNLAQCMNPSCGVIWLNPMPLEEDLPKAYRTYYTHQNPTILDGLVRRLYYRAKRGYLASHYGYYAGEVRWVDRMMGYAFYLHPGRKAALDSEVFFLRYNRGGKLLEVGCGSGVGLKLMADRGWMTEGIDFDPSAVENARSKGLVVHLGALESQNFAEESFDAIALSHVIEHVPNPQDLFQECFRILKKGGQLVIITPNSKSFGHSYFGPSWRGLEPPRHLHLFNQTAIEKMAKSCEYIEIASTTTICNAANMFSASWAIIEMGSPRMENLISRQIRIKAGAMQIWEWLLLKVKPGVGEELVLFAKKPSLE